MNNMIARLYMEGVSHRVGNGHTPESKLVTIVGNDYLKRANELKESNEVSACLMLLQAQLIPLRTVEKEIKDGNCYWSLDFSGWSNLAFGCVLNVNSKLHTELEAAVALNQKSDYKKIDVYLRSDRFKNFREGLFEKARRRARKMAEPLRHLPNADQQQINEEMNALREKHYERIRSSICHLSEKSTGTKKPLSWHDFGRIALERLIDNGFFNLEHSVQGVTEMFRAENMHYKPV